MNFFGESKKQQIERLQSEIDKLHAENDALRSKHEELESEYNTLNVKYNDAMSQMPKSKIELTAIQMQLEKACQEIEYKNNTLIEMQSRIDEKQRHMVELQKQIDIFSDEIDVYDYGLYHPTYEFANSDLYKDALKEIRQAQKDRIKEGTACTGSANYSVNGNLEWGQKMVSDIQKLLLRAFNAECDDIVAHVRVSNVEKSEKRIHSISETISKLGKSMCIAISPYYVDLKMKELHLALDYAEKKAEEKEHLKELRAQKREEAKAQKEIEEARKKLAKEQTHYQNALKSLSLQLEKDPENEDLIAKKAELEADIADTEKAIADVDYREANRRAGYVYVISNIGAFGKDVYKIGMTRRLDPMDRVNELGDASVPFNFDVHALIFTEDAPGLEAALHTAFEDRKVNKVNPRREFFRVTLDEIKKVVRSNFDKTVEWVDVPEAEQYRQSLIMK